MVFIKTLSVTITTTLVITIHNYDDDAHFFIFIFFSFFPFLITLVALSFSWKNAKVPNFVPRLRCLVVLELEDGGKGLHHFHAHFLRPRISFSLSHVEMVFICSCASTSINITNLQNKIFGKKLKNNMKQQFNEIWSILKLRIYNSIFLNYPCNCYKSCDPMLFRVPLYFCYTVFTPWNRKKTLIIHIIF